MMRVVLVTGIFPPDLGGPATHAADLAAELRERRHRVVVLTLGDGSRIDRTQGLVRIPRAWPWPARHAWVLAWLRRHRSRFDVVYATGLHPSAVAGALLANRPCVVKVVGDATWERARRLGLTTAGFDRFQEEAVAGQHVRAMRASQRWWLRRASAITAPSEYLAGIVERWLGGPAGVVVIPGGVRAAPDGTAPRRRGRFRAVFAGRLVAHKNVDLLLEAVARTNDIELEVIGEGPELPALRLRAGSLHLGDRARFSGPLEHGETLRRLADADALVLASGYEGLPHVAIEALACGTPVVTTAVGGVTEIVRDGVNGIVVPAAGSDAMTLELERLRDDPDLRARLSAGARREGERWRFERCVSGVERLLGDMIRGKPAAVFVGKGALPHGGRDLERKHEILLRHLRPTLVTQGAGRRWVGRIRVIGIPRIGPRSVAGALYHATGPALGAVIAAARGGAVVCQSPFEGVGAIAASRALPGDARPPIVVEVHGDWRSAARLYGSHLRRPFAPLLDRAAGFALRRADRVRAVGEEVAALVRVSGYSGPIDVYHTFTDLEPLLASRPAPFPTRPVAAFIGGPEPSKGGDVLAGAWPAVRRRLPSATLEVAGGRPGDRRPTATGDGTGVRVRGRLDRGGVVRLLDASSLLVVPSRSEGLPRVVLEAFARGRPVVGTSVTGIRELVEDGRTGSLVPPDDPTALGRALADLLDDQAALREMGAAARRRIEALDPMGAYEAGTERLAGWIEERRRARGPSRGRVRNLLLFNLATDADDPVLGFTTGWIGALAARVDRVDVVSMRTGRLDVPANAFVHSVGKELGYSEPRRAVEFYRILFGLLRSRRYDACFAHMAPLFVLMGAPILKPRAIPITLWYVHGGTPPLLRGAHAVADSVVTAAPETFPLRSGKVVVAGHGIDTVRFAPRQARRPASTFAVLSVGRIAPVKRLEILIRAVRRLLDRGIEALDVRIVGPVGPRDLEYARRLRLEVRELGLEDVLRFTGPAPPEAMPDAYRDADVLVSLTARGSADKAPLEALACGVPVITSSPWLAASMGEVSPSLGRPAATGTAVSEALERLLEMDVTSRRALSEPLRELVVRRHSLDRLADRLVSDVLLGAASMGAGGAMEA